MKRAAVKGTTTSAVGPCSIATGSPFGIGRPLIAAMLTALFLATAGCSRPEPKPLTLATTTSTRDSGLLDLLVPKFEQRTGIHVKVVAVGSGQALELGRRGDADVLLTHAPDAEQQFVAAGHGEERQPVMHNDFIVVGPPADPAEIKVAESAVDAFRRIAAAQLPFVSRGDESGTHIKEQKLWNKAHVQPAGDWYIQAGTGMAQTLRMAYEKRAYTLSDRATYLTQKSRLRLAVLSEGDELLQNPYSVIVVNPQKHPQVMHAAAQQFAQFLRSPETRRIISAFGANQFGQPLFIVDE